MTGMSFCCRWRCSKRRRLACTRLVPSAMFSSTMTASASCMQPHIVQTLEKLQKRQAPHYRREGAGSRGSSGSLMLLGPKATFFLLPELSNTAWGGRMLSAIEAHKMCWGTLWVAEGHAWVGRSAFWGFGRAVQPWEQRGGGNPPLSGGWVTWHCDDSLGYICDSQCPWDSPYPQCLKLKGPKRHGVANQFEHAPVRKIAEVATCYHSCRVVICRPSAFCPVDASAN